MNLTKPFEQKQCGATLLVSLVLLLMLTILAISFARTGALQQRMASNSQQKNLAFQMAESGIAAAVLRLTDDKPKPDGTKNLCAKPSSTLPVWDAACPADKQFYRAEVTKIDCIASSGADASDSDGSSVGAGIKSIGGNVGGCYQIVSSGHYNDHTVKHQQGVRFNNKK